MLKPEDTAPNVEPFAFYIEAFRELSTCRPSSMGGLYPIPFVSIVEYSKIYDVDDFFEFLDVIRQMDSELMLLENKETKKNTNGTTVGKKSN